MQNKSEGLKPHEKAVELETEDEEKYDVSKDYEAFFTSDESTPGGNVNITRQIDKISDTLVPSDRPVQPPEPSDTDSKTKVINKKKAKAEKKRRLRRKEQIRTFTHVFGSVLLIVFIISVSVFLAQYIVRATLDFMGITVVEFNYTVDIPEGALTEEIADILYEYEIINMPGLFCFYSRMSEKDGNYLHGLFTVNSTMSYSQIISTLQTKTKVSETVDVTIIDGMTAREIGLLLEENYVCRAEDFEQFYKSKMNVYNFEKRVLQSSLKFNQLEGYLFPDSYNFYVLDDLKENPDLDTSSYAEIAAKTIYSNYNSKITPEMYKRINEMGFTLDEFMTVASMVQREAGSVEDMGKVASVFLNRLKNSEAFPYMQSDVTIIYAEENIRPYITDRNSGIYELTLKAYNSYESEGLPPSPICSPGMDAMMAVLYPPDTSYFYFCANVETLQMFFAETLTEHEENLLIAGVETSPYAVID